MSPLLPCSGHERHDQHRRLPAFDRERAPDALSGLTIVPPCFDEAENVPDAVRLGPGPRPAAGTLRELADLRRALRDRQIPRVGV